MTDNPSVVARSWGSQQRGTREVSVSFKKNFIYFVNLSVMPQTTWDLSFPTRAQTCALCVGSMEP